MKITRGIGKVVKPLVNFPRWIGVSSLKQTAQALGKEAKSAFTEQKPEHQETYAEAIERLGLSTADVQRRMQWLLRFAMVYVGLASLIFIYALYLLISGHVAAGLLSLVITVFVLTLAFREHFRYFQMRTQHLGCTFKDWLLATFTFGGGSK